MGMLMPPRPSVPGAHWVTCDSCGGRRYIDGAKICEKCSGDGEILIRHRQPPPEMTVILWGVIAGLIFALVVIAALRRLGWL